MRFCLVTFWLVGACAYSNGPAADDGGGDDGGDPDAPPADDIDAAPGTPDAPPQAGGVARLALSEVVLTPNEGEMIEIANPTAAAVDLSDYWITDVATYYQLPAGTASISPSDFVARFPAGAQIAAGAVQTIALPAATVFQTRYGAAPTYAVTGGTMTVMLDAAMTPATITNTGEPVILFYWDGESDLVTDVDLLIAGAPSMVNQLQNKSGAVVDGPDGDSSTSAYTADAMSIGTTNVPGIDQSIKRVMAESGFEGQSGTGNGVMGDDETSETTTTTWDTAFTTPDPGVRSF
jgi:hypothetical protein